MFRDLQYGELQTINAHMFQCATDMRCPDVVFNASPEVPLIYIYGVEPSKFMKLPMDSSSVTQNLSSLL